MVVALQDDHVAAVALAPFEIASAGGSFLNRRDDLDELAADRHQRILKSECFDRWIAMTNLKAENLVHVIDNRRELARDERQLSKSEPHDGSPKVLRVYRPSKRG